MKRSHGMIGLFRATCDALEAAIRGAESGIAFNGYRWIGGPLNEVAEVDIPIVKLKGNHRHVYVSVSDVLSQDESREIQEQLQGHAWTHCVKLTI